MPEQVIHERPTVSPFEPVDERTRQFVESFGRRVHRNPALYAHAIHTLGEEATSNSIAMSQINEHLAGDLIDSKGINPQQFLRIFFAERHDFEAVFDPETERALIEDTKHATLQNRHVAMSSRNRLSKGQVRKGSTEEATEARDAVRRHRVQFFIQRVQAWRLLEQNDTLPSAG